MAESSPVSKETTFPAELERSCGLTEVTRKKMLGLLIVVGISVSWVSATQFAQSTYSPNFRAPYFTTWFVSCWAILNFPLLVLARMFKGQKIKDVLSEGQKVFGAKGVSIRSFLLLSGTFCLLALLANYLYILALGEIHAADVTAIFSSSSAFVYILSCIFLKEKLSILRFISVVLAISGIVLFAYAEGFKGGSVTGIIMTVLCAVVVAIYTVFLKRRIGDARVAGVAMYLSSLGLFCLAFMWVIVLIFHYTTYEPITWSFVPWTNLCGTGLLMLIFDFLINFGVAFTFPLFISLGTLIGIPLNALVDYLYKGKSFGPLKIVGALFLVAGFALILVPVNYENKFIWDRFQKKGEKKPPQNYKMETEV